MAELKTKPNQGSVSAFLKSIPDAAKRTDALTLLDIFKQVTGEKPVLWGSSIVGFGNYRYRSERTGREGDWFLTGFSPRKQNLTLYIISGFAAHGDLMKKLGKHKTGGGCLYINRLSDVHLPTLKALVRRSIAQLKRTKS
jgi:hypothetical protein